MLRLPKIDQSSELGIFINSPVMFLLYEMVPGPESHEMSIISRCRDRDTSGTAYICMAQLVGQYLQLVSGETVVVPQYVVVRWSACTLEGSIRQI